LGGRTIRNAICRKILFSLKKSICWRLRKPFIPTADYIGSLRIPLESSVDSPNAKLRSTPSRGDRKLRKRSLCPAATLFALIAACVFAAAAPCLAAQPAVAKNAVDSKVPCDRACLEGVMNRYLDAMVAHNPSQVPLAPDVQYAQDNVRLKIGQAL
jgi:hypothetical protein